MITIDVENFPDANFRNWLLQQEYGKNGVLTDEDLRGVTRMAVNSKGIISLKGIEHCHIMKLWST